MAACSNADGRSIEAAQNLVKSTLRDPDSAKFREIAVHGQDVCGEFNAKNAFGGMVGYEPFAVVNGKLLGATGLAPTGDATTDELVRVTRQTEATIACIEIRSAARRDSG